MARRRSRAGRSTTRRAGSSRSASASTRSARRGTSRTRSSRSRSGRPIRRSSTIGRAASTSRGPARPGRDGVWDVLLGHGGRGRGADRRRPPQGVRPRATSRVIPQTSTIASHLPRAVGIAFAIERARELGVECAWPHDAVVVCSFGDASLNHATAQAALNTAAYLAYGGTPLPLLFVCEDNGLGISVPTPEAWVEQSLHGRPELAVERADGDDPAALLATAQRARRVGARAPPSRGAAPSHRALPQPRRRRPRDRLPRPARRSAPDYARDPLLALGRWLVARGRADGRRARRRVPRDA